ncbi:neuronal acetylcholine receptor subunit alpha-10-like [Lineus longissimus]|uniref:neuronal acetylcholine receptor subunit alpha-10-like n=1 Tax=Lineus longissimus TaxID=88925 RepID=UPI002B4EC90A
MNVIIMGIKWTRILYVFVPIGYMLLDLVGAFHNYPNDYGYHGYQRLINTTDPTRALSDEQRLLYYIMTNYENSVRPVQNASQTVNIDLGITLNQIFDVDERNQVLTTHIWLDQEWTDEKLTWDKKKFNNIEKIRIPCNKLWLPDIVLYNSADDHTDGYMAALAMVNNQGRVFWPPIVKLRSTCSIDITYFPFDDQICLLKFGSWAYDGTQVDVFNRSNGVDLKNYVSNGEWELIDVKVVRNYVIYSCCPEPYPDITFTLHMRRRTLYYTYNVIVPCIMLSALTLLGFWMPPDSGEKVTLGLTVLLAFSVFMLLIAESMPATSFYVPLIGVYLTVVMFMTSLSVMLAVIISNLHHQGETKDNEVPNWLRGVAARIGKFFKIPTNVHSRSERRSPSPTSMRTPLRESMNGINLHYIGETSSECNLIEYENGENTSTKHKLPGNGTYQGKHDPKKKSRKVTEGEEILRRLSIIIKRQEEQRMYSQKNRDWQEVARLIDRCLFYAYFIILLSSTVSILLLVPLGKNVKIEHDSS